MVNAANVVAEFAAFEEAFHLTGGPRACTAVGTGLVRVGNELPGGVSRRKVRSRHLVHAIRDARQFFARGAGLFRASVVLPPKSSHDRRRIVHFDVTQHPIAGWLSRKVTEAFPWDTWARISITHKSLNVADGTTNMSMAAMPIASLRRKLRQVGDGVPRLRSMYFATVAWLTSMPSFSSSPWMRGASQSGLSLFICRIRSRTSRFIEGRPDFERQLQ
jgi:hypothetical protein